MPRGDLVLAAVLGRLGSVGLGTWRSSVGSVRGRPGPSTSAPSHRSVMGSTRRSADPRVSFPSGHVPPTHSRRSAIDFGLATTFANDVVRCGRKRRNSGHDGSADEAAFGRSASSSLNSLHGAGIVAALDNPIEQR